MVKKDKKMDTTQNVEITKLMYEILVTTMKMKEVIPEVYKHLDETPMFNSVNSKELNSSDFEEYLNTVLSQLKMIYV